MKQILLINIFSLLLIGCTPNAIRVDLTGVDESSLIRVKDLRPSAEKESEHYSYFGLSDSYGIFRWGDETISPRMTEVFRHLAYEKLKKKSKDLNIVIYHLVVYSNSQASLRNLGLATGIGGVAGAITSAAINAQSDVNHRQSLVNRSQFEELAGKDYERAFYSNEENPEHADIYVVYIDADINGKRVFIKYITPNKMQDEQNPYVIAVKSSIQYFLSYY